MACPTKPCTDRGLALLRRPLLPVVVAIVLTALLTHVAFADPVLIRNREGDGKRSPQSEVIYEGMASYGNYRLFGAAETEKLYSSGLEFDREVRSSVLGARVDYVSAVLPVLLLIQPAKSDIWGNTSSKARTTVPGAGITPIGFRLLWRDGKRWMPYWQTEASVLGFTQKALSADATYENWSFHLTGGLKLKLHGRYDLRLGMLSDLHFSNAFVVRSNPALDVLNASVGIVYHLGGRSAYR